MLCPWATDFKSTTANDFHSSIKDYPYINILCQNTFGPLKMEILDIKWLKFLNSKANFSRNLLNESNKSSFQSYQGCFVFVLFTYNGGIQRQSDKNRFWLYNKYKQGRHHHHSTTFQQLLETKAVAPTPPCTSQLQRDWQQSTSNRRPPESG